MADHPERPSRFTAALTAVGIDAAICCLPTEVLLLTGYGPVMGARVADAAAHNVMEPHDMGKTFRPSTGHGADFAAANHNGLPRLHSKSPNDLEKGMTFNDEPAANFDGYGGMRPYDKAAVRNAGTNALREL